MTDSHCHLDACDDPISAADPSLEAIISVGTSVAGNQANISLAGRIENVWAAVGIHPNDAGQSEDAEVRSEVERQARLPRVVAIGETGFDIHWDRETLASQRSAFDWHADLARRLNLPLILHVRDRQGSNAASREAVTALREAGHGKGVLHCFNGHPELLEIGLELGWFVSFAGNLTYPSAKPLREAAREVPEGSLLVETDSPYLAPVPQRGKRNRPEFVRHTAAKLAEVRGVAIHELEGVLDQNARRFFGI